MRYSQAIKFLFGLQKFGIKLGLENITKLLSALGDPHKKLHCVHVAGSNGKGSTCAFLQTILKNAGYNTGLYTSPHLIDFTERIRINDACISRSEAAELIADLKRICQKKALPTITFFEFATALAFKFFQQNGADPVIVETGMGGTYDATNVITPLLSIITTISLEHQKYLGRTKHAIAHEKAGIIKPGIPLVCGVRDKQIQVLLRHVCTEKGSPMLAGGHDFHLSNCTNCSFSYEGMELKLSRLQSGLRGDHQRTNAALAITASLLLRKHGYVVSEHDIQTGIHNTFWPGRLEVLGIHPLIIADGAHNPEGWHILAKALARNFSYKRLILVLGVMQDKNIHKMLKILTQNAYATILCRPKIERAADRSMLENFISFSAKKRVFWMENSVDAYALARSLARCSDLICITGSLFLVGELREMILKPTARPSGRLAL